MRLHSSRMAGPPRRWIAPSTPPPPSSVEFAALTTASTACSVMSPRSRRSRALPISSSSTGSRSRCVCGNLHSCAPLSSGAVGASGGGIGQPERERAAHARRAAHQHVAAEQASQPPRDAEAEPRAVAAAGSPWLDLPAGLDEPRVVLGSDAVARILPVDVHSAVALLEAEPDLALARDVDRVGQETGEDLPDLRRVGIAAHGVLRQIELQLEPALGGARL